MGNLREKWDEFGHVVFAFLEALAIPWNVVDLYENLEDVFYNALVAYYLIMIIMMQNDERYGSPFKHFLPRLTTQNTLGNLGNWFGSCRYWDPEVPFMRSKTREYGCEPFFGNVKKHVKGMPRLKDMVIGAFAKFRPPLPNIPGYSRSSNPRPATTNPGPGPGQVQSSIIIPRGPAL